MSVGDVLEAGSRSSRRACKGPQARRQQRGRHESFVAWAHEQMGGLNGLVNNAGILRDGLLVKKDRTTGEIKKLSTVTGMR